MASLPCPLHRRAAPSRLPVETDLAAANESIAMWRLMALAALDQLALVATVPEQYEQIQRELRKEREGFMTAELTAERAIAKC